MENNAREEIHKDKRSSVRVEEIDADDVSVEPISISDSLVEILIKDPVCGRSDYSASDFKEESGEREPWYVLDLPGVRRGICSSWRSFAEFPRRPNTSARYQASTSANSEQRQQKNYQAKIRRETLSFQRLAKREHLRAQQRERRRQQTILSKIQDQSSGICNNPGIIISSPQKGSPKKPFRRYSSQGGQGHQRKIKCVGDSKTTHDDDDVPRKSLGECKDKVSDDVNNFEEVDDNDDVVSTTSAHHRDDNTSKSPKTSLVSTVSSATTQGIFDSFKDSEDNPVTSSSQDNPPETSLTPVLSDASGPSACTTCIVTSTTTPEIAVADSSTMSTPQRKTRNVKRVDYTEMLEDDFDHDLPQIAFRESVNSGRKIRPVKRTLEKAIVDASLKKSPRKKKSGVDKKERQDNSGPDSLALSSTDAEDEKIKQICDTIKQMTESAKQLSANTAHIAVKKKKQLSASTAHVAVKKTNARLKHKQKQCVPGVVSPEAPAQSLPSSASAVFQPQSLCLSSTSGCPPSVHTAFVSESLSNVQHGHSHNFVTSMPASTSLNFPLVLSYQQQPHPAPFGHPGTIPLSAVIPSHSLHNSTVSAFNSAMQSPFQKRSPLVNAQNAVRYPANSVSMPAASMQTHTSQILLPGVPSFPKDTVVYDMKQSVQPPDFFLVPQTFTRVTNQAAGSMSTYQPVMRQETAASVGIQLNGLSSGTYQHPSSTQQNMVVTAAQQQLLSVQVTDNNLAQFITSSTNINGNSTSAVTNTRSYKDGAEVLSCKKQSQFDVESMLNSIPRSKMAEKNDDNSDKLSCNKMLSSEITHLKNLNGDRTFQSAQNTVFAPGLTSKEIPGFIPKAAEVQNQPQYVTFSLVSQGSSPKGCSPHGQRVSLQPSNQGLQTSQGTPVGPPPLISVSDLLNSSVSVPSFGINQGTSASLTYQNVSSLTAPHTKYNMSSRGTLPSTSLSILEKSSATSERATHIESLMQRAVMTAKPTSTAYFTVGSLPQHGMQSQLAHSALQYSDVFHLSSQMKHVLPYSGRKQDQQLRMPALMSCINNPRPTDGTKETSRKPEHCFTDKPVSHSTVPQQNLTPEQRVTGTTIGRQPQVPISQEGRHPTDESVSSFSTMYQYPPPGFASRPGGMQQPNTPKQKTVIANPRIPAQNSDLATLHAGQPPAQRQILSRQEPTRSRGGTSATGKLSQDKMLQKASLAVCSQPSNPQGIQSRIFQQSPLYHPKSSDSAKVPNANPGMSHPVTITEDQRALERISVMMQSSSTTLPNRIAGPPVHNTNLISSSQYTVRGNKPALKTLQVQHQVRSGSLANPSVSAIDLSQKTSVRGQKTVTMVVTSSVSPSVTVTSRLQQQKPVTMVGTLYMNPSVTVTSRLPQQNSLVSSVTEISRFLQQASSFNPAIFVTSRLLQQKPATVLLTSSVNSSAAACSQQPVTLLNPPNVNPLFTPTSKLPYHKMLTTPATSSFKPPATPISGLPTSHSTTTSHEVPQDYPLTRSQIKQENVSQYEQSENDARNSLQADSKTGHMPAEETVTSHHMPDWRPKAVTSSFSSQVSSQNCSLELTKVPASHSSANSYTTVNALRMPLPTLQNNPLRESSIEHIKIKVEAYLSPGDSSDLAALSQAAVTVASSVPLPQSALSTGASLVPVSASVTSAAAGLPHLSDQTGMPRPSGVKPQTNETAARLCEVPNGQSDIQHDVSSQNVIAMKDALPAHIRIKQEIYAEATESLEPVSSPNVSSTLHSLVPASTASVNYNATDLVVEKPPSVSSGSVSTLTADSSESLPPEQLGQSSGSTIESVTLAVTHNINQHPLTLTESCSVETSQNSQSLIPKANSHSQCVSDSLNSACGISMNSPQPNQKLYTVIKVENSSMVDSSSRSTSGNSSASSSIPECLAAASQTTMPVCPLVITTEAAVSKAGQMPATLVSSSCGKHPPEAPAKTQIAVVIPPLLTANKQPTTIKASPSKLISILYDPLFAWHTDSNKQLSSFSLEDITDPSPQESQYLPGLCSDFSVINNNSYTIAVSYPCTDNSELQHCDMEASSVDMSVVKDEPTVEPNLNRREVIDLCLSDGEENDPINNEASACMQTSCPDYISSVSNLTCSAKSKDALENMKESGSSGLQNCDMDASSVDMNASSVDMNVVKAELSVEPGLNRREVIDLCLSDGEENDPITTEASACLHTACPNYVSSVSILTCSSQSKDVFKNVKTALSAVDSKDKHFSKDNLQETPTEGYSMPSGQHNSMRSLEKSNTGYSSISQLAGKQLIMSPLTGQNVSGEHMTLIRKRLARISTDLVSITADVSESEVSPASARDLRNTSPLKVTNRLHCDSAAQASEPEQSPFPSTATEPHPSTSQPADKSAGTSKTQVRKKLFKALEVNTKRTSSTRKRTHGVEVKTEDVEIISIDDDSSDDENQLCNSSEVNSSSSPFMDAPSCIFSIPFGSSSTLSPEKDLSGSESSVLSPSHGGGRRLASIANWTDEKVSKWLRDHKLDKVCPNLKNLNGPGLQRMAFEHWRDPNMFYERVKKTLGLTFFQTMVICHSMKELNESGLDE